MAPPLPLHGLTFHALLRKKPLWAGLGVFFLLTAFYFWNHRVQNPDEDRLAGNGDEKTWGAGGPQVEDKFFTVALSPLLDSIDGLIGTVKGDTLSLAFGGQEEKLAAIHVRVGDFVEKGETLFELDHVRSLARLKQAQIALDRSDELMAVGGATLEDVQEAQAQYDIARKDYDESFILAPKRGTISEINKRVRETVSRNEIVAVLVSAQDEF